MTTRYSNLSILPIEEQADICFRLCAFFAQLEADKMRTALKLPIRAGYLDPLSLMDFFKFYKGVDIDYWPKMQRIRELVEILKYKGILHSYGGANITEKFLFMKELTNREKKGKLWMGLALGESFIGNEIKKDIAFIEAMTSDGDLTSGTGILITPNIVLTCEHVVKNMRIEFVEINTKKIKVNRYISHEIMDVGLIYLDENVHQQLPDLAFRNARTLEPLVIAGYPKVPCSLNPCFTLQTGQYCGHVAETIDKCPLDLFSAIARPGNSGGPVGGLDGCIIGMVAKSLERERELADYMEVLPFFAAVPSAVISESIKELTNGEVVIQWENYA